MPFRYGVALVLVNVPMLESA
jgi:hypothetical protein